jgi:hypothetical protein
MGGWSNTGFRRYLSRNESEEKRTIGNMLSVLPASAAPSIKSAPNGWA